MIELRLLGLDTEKNTAASHMETKLGHDLT